MARARVDTEIERDQLTLKKILLSSKEREEQLNALQARNREVEMSIDSIEETTVQRQTQCESERQEHNKQTKVLMDLKTDIRESKQEKKILLNQIGRLKEDISRTNNNLFREHIRLHDINEERQGIAKDARTYTNQSHELKLTSEMLDHDIDNLCGEIEREDKKLANFFKIHRYNVREKDIIVSCENHLFIIR